MFGVRVQFVRKFCLRLVGQVAERKGIKASEAAEEIAETWLSSGKRPMTDSAGEQLGGQRLGILKPKMKEGLNTMTSSEWRKVRFCVDSGAGETVLAEDELPEIETKESWGSKHGQKYEVANGEEIGNVGEKRFVAHMVMVDGEDSGPRGVTAQVCDVHRPLMAVKRVCRHGNRVVFDEDGSYVENKQTG